MNFVSSITLAFKDAFSAGFSEAKDNLAGMKSALDEINENKAMTSLAADMSMMAGMTEPMRKALSGALDQPSKIAGSLDSAFRNIQVSSGATNEEMATMRRELLAIGGRAVAGPQAVANAFANVSSGISDASKHMAVMNSAVALSEANQADLAMSTNALVNVMNAWNLSADQAALAADIFTQTTMMGVGSLDEFAGSISNISALAANAGIGLDELGSSFAYVTNKGLSAGQVQKQLKGIISTLVSPSESLANIYEALGFESGQAMIQQYGLAESLYILKEAVGDDQAFSSMIGSVEAATVALALTEDAYVDFATSFASGMGTITEAARGVQLESIEMKMARLDAASQSLQAQIGQDINGIKGFFIDMKFGFLSNVVSPIMNSPVGGVVSKIAAVTGMAAKTMLDMGSGALNAAAQMTTLAANISNAGGIAKMFTSTLGLLKSGFTILTSPIKAAVTSVIGFIANLFGIGGASGAAAAGTGAFGAASAASAGGVGVATVATTGFAASLWAATWPILAVVAAIALVAGGVYLLIKNWDKVAGFFKGLWDKIVGFFSKAWDWIKNLIFGTSDWILGAVAIFFPIIGIPALIIKHWDAIKDFFGNLFEGIKNVAGKAWDGIKSVAGNAWTGIKNVAGNAWEGIKSGADWLKNKASDNFDKVKEFAGNTFNKVLDVGEWGLSKLEGRFPGLANTGREVLGALRQAASGDFSGIQELGSKALEGLKNGFSNFKDFASEKLSAVGNFFGNVFEGIKNVAGNVGDFFKNVWDGAVGFVKGIIDSFRSFFSSVFDTIKTVVGLFSDFFKNVFVDPIGAVKNLFFGIVDVIIGIFDSIKEKVQSFVSFFCDKFKIVGDVIGGVKDFFGGVGNAVGNAAGAVGNFFSGLFGGGKESGAALNDSFASGIQSNASAPAQAFTTSLQGVSSQMPHSDAPEGPLSTITASGRALTDTFASGMEEDTLREKASLVFSAAMPQGETVELPSAGDGASKGVGSQTIHIQNLYLQADECQNIFDFVKMIMHSVERPQEAIS